MVYHDIWRAKLAKAQSHPNKADAPDKVVHALLKEVAMNAVSTFGPGAFVDGAFGGISKGEGLSDINSSWSDSNLTSKGWDYTFGANGGYFRLGDSGMTRLSENAIKSSIGWGIGLV